MKKYIICIVIISIFVSGCSSTKDKYNALNNYFETIVRYCAQKVIIVKQECSPNLTLEVLQANQINANGIKRRDRTLYNEKDWETMKKKYERIQLPEQGYLLEDEFWTKDDFKHKRIILEHYKTQYDLINKYLDMRDYTNYKMYFFSDPIYYHKKKYLVFVATKSSIIGGGTTIAVIMEKKQEKWVQTYEAYPSWF